ncbi:MAG: F0F1 ATP synthase subunit epsilon [Acholeplasmatales bacterium]|nr:F0F1 ATP synthase subunit epsilon [Acholeplasmatales bacterium]
MKIIVSTHQGVLLEEEADYIQVCSDIGNFGILNNHVPLVTIINTGYIKYTNSGSDKFAAICGGIFEFHDNVATVLAQEAAMGADENEAQNAILAHRYARMEINRRESADFTKKEKELYDNIKEANAGNL